jgi:hypothetical protein
MFGGEYFSFSFPELVGTVVTIVGIWLVVRQLKETRQASQMESFLLLNQAYSDVNKNAIALKDLVGSNPWKDLSDEKAFVAIKGKTITYEGYNDIFGFFDLMGMLVRRNVLDEGMARETWGKLVSIWWGRVERMVRYERVDRNWPELGQNWEWLADRFE